jgi:hypothetical protein
MITFDLLTNQTQNATTGCAHLMFQAIAGKTVTLTLSGNPSGGDVLVEVHDGQFETWTDVPGLTLNAQTLTASAVLPATADGLRARLVGADSPDVTVTGTAS